MWIYMRFLGGGVGWGGWREGSATCLWVTPARIHMGFFLLIFTFFIFHKFCSTCLVGWNLADLASTHHIEVLSENQVRCFFASVHLCIVASNSSHVLHWASFSLLFKFTTSSIFEKSFRYSWRVCQSIIQSLLVGSLQQGSSFSDKQVLPTHCITFRCLVYLQVSLTCNNALLKQITMWF